MKIMSGGNMTEYKTIAETNRFIVLDRYDKDWKLCESYQSEMLWSGS